MYLRACTQNLQVCSYVLMYLRAVKNLQVSSYVLMYLSQNLQEHLLMYLSSFRTYKSVVMYSCISEHSELSNH